MSTFEIHKGFTIILRLVFTYFLGTNILFPNSITLKVNKTFEFFISDCLAINSSSPSTFETTSCEPFEDAYKVGTVLGKGGFGIVYSGIRKRDGFQVAIKHIAKTKIKEWGVVSAFFIA